MSGYYSTEELKEIGFKSLGKNVLISRTASFYPSEEIEIGNNIRIDDNCVISGSVKIGNHVHISAGCVVYAGKFGVVFEDFSGISSRCAIYAQTDDYSGYYMTNPTIDMKYRNVFGGKVILKKHVVVGTGSTILPNVTLEEGCSIGAMSLVNRNLEPWGVYVGIPCKKIKNRKKIFFEDYIINGK